MANFDGVEVTSDTLSESECMILAVQGKLNEVFGWPDVLDLEQVRGWSLAYLNTRRNKLRANDGLTEAMYYEALRWQSDPSSPLALNPGRLSAEAYAAQVVGRWDKIESDYNLGVSLINQAGDVDTVAIILSRRG